MSRIKRFTHSLLSGYLLLGVNVLFSIGSVPMALHYLGKAELPKENFDLWILTTNIATYVALMDFGLSAAASRILIDYREHPVGGEYGATILTGALVGLSQAALILLAGPVLAYGLVPLLKISPDLEHKFIWLVIGQSGITALMFATRIVSLVLTANQRFDVTNYGGSLSLAVNFGVVWWAFCRGSGVYSMLWGQGAAALSLCATNLLGCFHLKLLPARGQWGRPSLKRFRELFDFGRDIFLFMLGNQFVNFSQTMLLTRLIGLDAAGNWGVCTRAYLLIVQVIGRVFDYSTSALAEMIVRDERDRLLRRFRELTVFSVNLAVVAGVLFAIANAPFVKIWTGGNFGWTPWNDVLLGVWLVIYINVRVHTGLVGQTKAFRFLRYLYFLEGLMFIGLTILLHRFGGITMMLIVSIGSSICCTFSYGLRRTRQYFHLSWRELAGWHRDTLTLTAMTVPAAVIAWWLVRNLSAIQQLISYAFLAIWMAIVFLRYGLGASLRAEASRLAPHWAKPMLGR